MGVRADGAPDILEFLGCRQNGGKVARYLAGWYENIQVFRFPDSEYTAFRQIVLFGVRHQRSTSPDFKLVEKLVQISKMGTELEVLQKAEIETYSLARPVIGPNKFVFESR